MAWTRLPDYLWLCVMITSGDWYRNERALVASSYHPTSTQANKHCSNSHTDSTPSHPSIRYDPYQVTGIKSRPSTPDLRLHHAPSSNHSYAPLSSYSNTRTLSNHESHAPSSNLSESHASSSKEHDYSFIRDPPSRNGSVNKGKHPTTEVSWYHMITKIFGTWV